MAATVAGRVALGFGVTPKVWPRWTGAVEAFTVLVCAGMAAVSAAFGCGARIMAGFAAFICGVSSLLSISTGFRAGLGSILGTLIFGCSSCISSLGFGGGGSLGGGGVLNLGGGGGVVGKISSVCSNLCSCRTCFAVMPI